VNRHRFDADPYPTLHSDTDQDSDPDPDTYSDPDPDPDSDPDRSGSYTKLHEYWKYEKKFTFINRTPSPNCFIFLVTFIGFII
jgi:hypothetical protein